MNKQSSRKNRRRRLSPEKRRQLRRRRRLMRRIKCILLYLLTAVLVLIALLIYLYVDVVPGEKTDESQLQTSKPELETPLISTHSPSAALIAENIQVQTVTSAEQEIEPSTIEISTKRIIDASSEGTAWISEGKLHIAGERFKDIDVSSWTDLREVSLGENHVAALDKQNRVWATGENRMGQCGVNGLENVASLTIGLECTVAVMLDGSLRFFGALPEGWPEMLSQERNVVQADMSATHLILLRRDGTASVYGETVSNEEWTGLKMVSAGHGFVVALKNSGELMISSGGILACQESLHWEDIAYVCAGNSHIAAIRKDGTAVAAGRNSNGECDVFCWKGINAIAAGYDHTAAMYTDGHAVAVGYQDNGQCKVF